MRSLKLSLLGTLVGTIIGAFSVIIAYASLSLGGEQFELPLAVVFLAVGSSTIIGGLCVALRCLVTRRERSVVAALVSVAAASLVVISGNFANGSAVPLLIYATAVVNGLLVARGVGPLCDKEIVSGQEYLS